MRERKSGRKKGETAGPYPFPFAFRTRRTKSFRFCLAVSKLPGWVTPEVSKSRRIATRRESICGVRSRRFYILHYFCLFGLLRKVFLLSSSRLGLRITWRYISYTVDNTVTIAGIRWTHIRILPVDTCVCVRVCVNACACACIAFSVSIVFGISQERGKKERKLYIGTSKKVYFTIPLAVEDRL